MWALDEPAFARPAEAVRDDQGPFPHHMYRKTGLNIEYLLSFSTLRLSALALRGSGVADLDKYEAWYDRFDFGEKAVLKRWRGSCAAFQPDVVPGKPMPASWLAQLRRSLQDNVATLVGAYPDVTFEIVLPPLATLYYFPLESRNLVAILAFRAAVAEELVRFPNVRLRDFQTVPWIVDDLADFKDVNHFGLGISDYIIDAVRDDRERLSSVDDVLTSNRALIDLVKRYDLCRSGLPELSR